MPKRGDIAWGVVCWAAGHKWFRTVVAHADAVTYADSIYDDNRHYRGEWFEYLCTRCGRQKAVFQRELYTIEDDTYWYPDTDKGPKPPEFFGFQEDWGNVDQGSEEQPAEAPSPVRTPLVAALVGDWVGTEHQGSVFHGRILLPLDDGVLHVAWDWGATRPGRAGPPVPSSHIDRQDVWALQHWEVRHGGLARTAGL